MQICMADVRLGGELLNTVTKFNVTPAEILVLRAIHGDDAVQNVRPLKMDNRSPQAEYDRLVDDYDNAGTLASPEANAAGGGLIDRLFPGAVKQFPKTLQEIGIDIETVMGAEGPTPNQVVRKQNDDVAKGKARDERGSGAEDAAAAAIAAAEAQALAEQPSDEVPADEPAEEEVKEEGPLPTGELKKMTKAELHMVAEAEDIFVESDANKATIIEAIEEARAEKDAE